MSWLKRLTEKLYKNPSKSPSNSKDPSPKRSHMEEEKSSPIISQPKAVVVPQKPGYICKTWNKVISKVEIATCWCTLICVSWSPESWPKCNKTIANSKFWSEFQGYFDNLHHLLGMQDKSQKLVDDLKQSNRDMEKFLISLTNPEEEHKEPTPKPMHKK